MSLTKNHKLKMSDSHVVELLSQGTDMLNTLIEQVRELHGSCPLLTKLCLIFNKIREAELRLNGEWYIIAGEDFNEEEEESQAEQPQEESHKEDIDIDFSIDEFDQEFNKIEKESQAEQPKEQPQEQPHEEEEERLVGSRKYPFSRLIKITKDGKEKRFYFRYRRRYLQIKECIQRISKLQPSLKLDETEKLIEVPRETRSEILQDALNFQKEVQKLLPSQNPDIQELANRTNKLVEIAQEAVNKLGK